MFTENCLGCDFVNMLQKLALHNRGRFRGVLLCNVHTAPLRRLEKMASEEVNKITNVLIVVANL